MKRFVLWVLSLFPAVALLAVIAIASIWAIRTNRTNVSAAGAYLEPRSARLLAITLVCVAVATATILCVDPIALAAVWEMLAGGPQVCSLIAGAVVGAVIAALYFGGLDQMVVAAQRRFGDYAAPEVARGFASNRGMFFIANVALAPAIEELWFRGLLFSALTAGYQPLTAAILGCAAFGLFHWPGGVGYVLVTGILAGGVFWGLALWDGTLWAPFAAHLTLNVIEFWVRAGPKTGSKP